MQWAVVTHHDHIKPLPNGRFVLMVPPLQIAEHCLPAALGQGWILLARDSEIVPAVDVNVNLHSNPRRIAESGEDV